MAHPCWPFFDLRLRTPRLELHPPTDDDMVELIEAAKAGIHDPDAMPFKNPWTDVPSPQLERNTLQWQWRMRAELSPEEWSLTFAVFLDGAAIGIQGMTGRRFATLRSFETGSWLGRAHQGQGIGKEMRAAVLQLGFEGLDAVEARSGAFVDNPQSTAVSRALGYEENGRGLAAPRGEARELALFRLTRERWEQFRAEGRYPEVEIDGLEPCLPLLGLG